MVVETIPLIIRSTGSSSFVTDVEVEIDGHTSLFLLDTGAVSSSVAASGFALDYPSLGVAESKGASGIATPVEIIELQSLRLGNFVYRKPRLKRANSSILGLDFIGRGGFEIDLKNLRLVLGLTSSIALSEPLRVLATGHFTIPLIIENTRIDALFDTGADATVIDSQFIKSHQNSFVFLRSESGTDGLGHRVESGVYICRSLSVGPLALENLEVVTFDFGANLRSKMEGAPLILGNNVIAKARWRFDLKTSSWSASVL